MPRSFLLRVLRTFDFERKPISAVHRLLVILLVSCYYIFRVCTFPLPSFQTSTDQYLLRHWAYYALTLLVMAALVIWIAQKVVERLDRRVRQELKKGIVEWITEFLSESPTETDDEYSRRSTIAHRALRNFMKRQHCDALIGDLEEGLVAKSQISIRKAYMWYWSQVVRSLAPVAWAAFVRRFNHFSRRT
jgi:hypothetical protein